MEEIINSAGQYGALGLMLLASFWYINKKDNIHREERKDVFDKLEKQHEEALQVVRSNTEAFMNLSVVIRDNK